MRSDSMASARSISLEGSVSKYAVQSIQVKAFSAPPRRETSLLISPLPKRLPPLNSMCSTQCDTPVVPGSSLRPPTRYHIQTPTSGRSRTSRTMTRRPLSSVVWVNDDAGDAALAEACTAMSLMLENSARAGGVTRSAGLAAAGRDRLAVAGVAAAWQRQAVLDLQR